MSKLVKGLGLLALAGGIAYVGLGLSTSKASVKKPNPDVPPKPGPDIPPVVIDVLSCPGPDVGINQLPEPCRGQVLLRISSAVLVGIDTSDDLGPAIEDDMLRSLAADLRAQGKKVAADQVDEYPRNTGAGGGMPAGYCPGPDTGIDGLREPCRTYVRQTLARVLTLEADPDKYAQAQGAGIRLRLVADLEREGKTQAAAEVRRDT